MKNRMVDESHLHNIRTRLAGLPPRQARWTIDGVPLHFDFSPERFNLCYVAPHHIVGGPVPSDWEGCRVFGDFDYSDGGGASAYIAIRERDGSICGLDPERPDSTIFVFNLSLDRFIDTFRLLDHQLRVRPIPAQDLPAQVYELDPGVFEISEWRILLDAIAAP